MFSRRVLVYKDIDVEAQRTHTVYIKTGLEKTREFSVGCGSRCGGIQKIPDLIVS